MSQARIVGEIQKTRSVIDAVLADTVLLDAVAQVATVMETALRAGKKILFCGNGGSAADSQHLAAELVSRLQFDRPGVCAIALTVDTSALTAIGNDYGFENVFSRQIEAIGQQGDILFAISTSGNSPNVVKAIEAAKRKGVIVVGKTGRSGGKMAALCDICLKMPSNDTPKIQECHIMLGHIYCSIVEQAMFGADYNTTKETA